LVFYPTLLFCFSFGAKFKTNKKENQKQNIYIVQKHFFMQTKKNKVQKQKVHKQKGGMWGKMISSAIPPLILYYLREKLTNKYKKKKQKK
jgi:hypothetical protein